MKELSPFNQNPGRALRQLEDLGKLLESKTELHETHDVLPFFRKRPHLSAFIGSLNPGITRVDRLAFEYDLWGDFRIDLVLGDSTKSEYTVVEFENAERNSVFKKRRGRYLPEWGARFEHGFSQLVDWFWRLEDQRKTDEFRNRFGFRARFFGMLVIGRKAFLDESAERRLNWRLDKVIVDSNKIACLTFDDLLNDLRAKEAALQLYQRTRLGTGGRRKRSRTGASSGAHATRRPRRGRI